MIAVYTAAGPPHDSYGLTFRQFHVNYTNMKSRAQPARAYRKDARADSERATAEAILDAARSAFVAEAFDRVTLGHIAQHSGVTVQTVIRRFGSKEGLFEALVERDRPRILSARESAPGAGLRASIERLVDHYENDGDLILNLVAQEHRTEAIGRVVAEGRDTHRAWVETHCADLLRRSGGAERERQVSAAIAATDLGTWKLLRRDLGHTRDDVVAIMFELVSGIERRSQ